MNKIGLEAYLYMGSTEPVIKWLESEGVKTREEARVKLAPLVGANVISWTQFATRGASLQGTVNASEKILNHFPDTK